MRIAGLEETQAGIKIAGRNIHNLRYVCSDFGAQESKTVLYILRWKEEAKKMASDYIAVLSIQNSSTLISFIDI